MVTPSHYMIQSIRLPPPHSFDANVSLKDNMIITNEKIPLPINLARLPLQREK
jgi:hypothetical protein